MRQERGRMSEHRFESKTDMRDEDRGNKFKALSVCENYLCRDKNP